MKKLLMLVAVGALVFWLLKDRLGGEPDEFVFAEAPAEEPAGPEAASDAPATAG